MKKKKLKALSLKKASVSKLNGGAASAPISIQLTRNIRDCVFSFNQATCTTTWYSELYTACQCEPSWDLGCQQSIGIPCES